MSSRVIPVEQLNQAEKSVIKDMKRELIKFIPLIRRRTRSHIREFGTPATEGRSSDYGKTYDHMNPTISSNQKRWDVLARTMGSSKIILSASKSSERTTTRRKLSRELKVSNPKKLVYPSVRKLKTMMHRSVSNEKDQSKQFRRILFDHINKNMKHLNLKVSKEIEKPSVSKMSTQIYPMRLPEIQKLGTQFKKIQINHKKAGIMRRNKLLLEHIMHERVSSKQIFRPGLQNFRTNVSVNLQA